MANTEVDQWSLDKRIPVPIIFTIVVQTLIIAFYVGALDNRVAQLEGAQIGRADERDRLVTLEAQTRSIGETLARIERRLDRDLDALTGRQAP